MGVLVLLVDGEQTTGGHTLLANQELYCSDTSSSSDIDIVGNDFVFSSSSWECFISM